LSLADVGGIYTYTAESPVCREWPLLHSANGSINGLLQSAQSRNVVGMQSAALVNSGFESDISSPRPEAATIFPICRPICYIREIGKVQRNIKNMQTSYKHRFNSAKRPDNLKKAGLNMHLKLHLPKFSC
jgi:hypothetical protein